MKNILFYQNLKSCVCVYVCVCVCVCTQVNQKFCNVLVMGGTIQQFELVLARL